MSWLSDFWNDLFGGGNNNQPEVMQINPSPLPQALFSTTPVNPSQEQSQFSLPDQGRMPTQPPPPAPAATTGDVAASMLSVPDFLLDKSPLTPQPPPKRSKLTTTNERGQSRATGAV